jgi:hypothetical protein
MIWRRRDARVVDCGSWSNVTSSFPRKVFIAELRRHYSYLNLKLKLRFLLTHARMQYTILHSPALTQPRSWPTMLFPALHVKREQRYVARCAVDGDDWPGCDCPVVHLGLVGVVARRGVHDAYF